MAEEGAFGPVTVVIPTRNRLQCLAKTLPSYLTQAHVQELLLVDDASDPPVEYGDLVRERSDLAVRVERLPRRHGQPAARNLAVRKASSEWLLFSDDDVFLEPDYVARLAAAQRRTGADILAGRRIMLVDGESREAAMERCAGIERQVFNPRLVDADFQAPIGADMEALHLQTTALIRRSAAAAIGWDEAYLPPAYREETDFYVRAAAAGHRLIFVADALCFHLPPSETRTGGQRARHWWQYEMGVVICNHRFLSRHYRFLVNRGAIEGPRWLAELRFAHWRLWGGFMRAIYLRYYGSRMRRVLHRLRGRVARAA